jgi:hypothetical protein
MHQLRGFVPPIPDYAPGEYDFSRPKLRFVSFGREELKLTYDFENLVSPLLKAAEARAGRPFGKVENAQIIIPVHELQVYHIREKFGTAIIYPEEFSLPLLAQQSLRYLNFLSLIREFSWYGIDRSLFPKDFLASS